jgi:5-methylcytosine-specific restriction endonuclease McrA
MEKQIKKSSQSKFEETKYLITFESLKEEMIDKAKKRAGDIDKTPEEVEKKIREDIDKGELEFPRASYLYLKIKNIAIEFLLMYENNQEHLEKGYSNLWYLINKTKDFKPIVLEGYQDYDTQTQHLSMNQDKLDKALQRYKRCIDFLRTHCNHKFQIEERKEIYQKNSGNGAEKKPNGKKLEKLSQKVEELIFRASLWEAHNLKCFYCTKLIPCLKDMEVDHIVPQKYKNLPEEFEKIKEEYELQPDLDIEAYYNKVPSHNGCNLRKSGHLYEKTPTSYYLQEAKLKIPIIRVKEQKHRNKISITQEILNKFTLEKLDEFFLMMGVSIEGEEEASPIEEIDERALQDHIDSFNNNIEIIREKGSEAFEWRYYQIRKQAMKLSNIISPNIPVLDALITLMEEFLNEENATLQDWAIDILDLLSNAPTLTNNIKEKFYERLKPLYNPLSTPNVQLIDLLDKFGCFSKDSILEIIKIIKNRNFKALNCFKNKLYNKEFTISRAEAQSYIDDISIATTDLEPMKSQIHKSIMQYANEVKELLNEIE